jgi:hypothetical protein
MNEKLNLGQLRICIQKTLKEHDKHLENLKNISTSDDHYTKLRAAFLNGFNWKTDATINIGFMGDGTNVPRKTYEELSGEVDQEGNALKVDPLQKTVDAMSVIDGIKAVVNQRIQPIVGIKLVFVDDYTQADVRIGFDIYDGAWALVGTQCLSDDPDVKGKPTMNLGWFDVSTTMHEFFHVLGLIHEHQNSKDNPIDWDKNAVYQWAQSTQNWDKQTTDQNILQTYSENQINGSIFDPLSIMLYFFPASLTKNQEGTRQNLRLSGYDVKYVSEKYPGGEMTPEDFYLKTYNQTLQDNINESTKDLYSKFPILDKNMLYITIGIIGILLLIILFLMLK